MSVAPQADVDQEGDAESRHHEGAGPVLDDPENAAENDGHDGDWPPDQEPSIEKTW